MKINQVAIVGLGNIGRRHLRILKDIRPDIEIRLVPSRGKNFVAEGFDPGSMFSIEEAVRAGVQAAIIASPAVSHVEQARILARAGVHLLVEKPVSDRVENVGALLTDVASAGVVGLVGYVLRYDPAARRFSEMVGQGVAGERLNIRVECRSYLPTWRPGLDYRESVSALRELGGGVLLELSHELDYIRWFFGESSSVRAHLYNSGFLGVDVEECADLILTGEKGVPVSLHLDFSSQYAARFVTVYGTQGTLTWDAIGKQVRWRPVGGEEEVEMFDLDRELMYRNQLRHFVDCVENGATPVVPLEDGAATLGLVDAARRSHESGQRVDLP